MLLSIMMYAWVLHLRNLEFFEKIIRSSFDKALIVMRDFGNYKRYGSYVSDVITVIDTLFTNKLNKKEKNRVLINITRRVFYSS